MIEIPQSVRNNILYYYREIERSLDQYNQMIESDTEHLKKITSTRDDLVSKKNEMSLFMSKNGISTND